MPLRDDDLKKWEYKAHTQVKHEILRKYLESWANVLARWHDTLYYFDCFAGRGRYADDEEGSPIIALNAIYDLKQKREHIKQVACTFIEKDKSNFENLCQILNEEISANTGISDLIAINPPINDEFVNVASGILNDGKKLPPSFFFIDPFGFSGIPLQIIKQILSVPKTEVFINFMIRDVNRFLDSPTHQRSIEDLFGVRNVKDRLKSQYSDLNNESALLKFYRQQLHDYTGVGFTFPFKVTEDRKLQTTYYLIHATNSLKGCEIMKNIMYHAGTPGRFGYLGPAEGQMALASFGGLFEFKKYLMEKFYGKNLTFEQVRIETVNETFYIIKDYNDALKELEDEKCIVIEGKGKKGAIKDTSLVIFDPERAKKNKVKLEEKDTNHTQANLFSFN
jgi:three-Cys-motif partner protein